MHSLSKLAPLQPLACAQAFIKMEQAKAAVEADASPSDSLTDLSTLAVDLVVTTSAAQVGMRCPHSHPVPQQSTASLCLQYCRLAQTPPHCIQASWSGTRAWIMHSNIFT